MSDNDYEKQFARKNLFLQEKQVINSLIEFNEQKRDYFLSSLKDFVTPDLELQHDLNLKGLKIAANILRQDIGFIKDEKPGDFDIIVIPFSEDKIFFERTGVIEVKIVRPSREKPSRNANSLGTTQLKGLINDGFPFIGIMHISMSEILNDEEKTAIKYCKLPISNQTNFEISGKIEDYFVPINIDLFQWYSADKQMQRLISTELPKYAAIICFGLSLRTDDKLYFETVSEQYSTFQQGYFNPKKKDDTVQKIKTHYENNKSLYKDKIFK